MTITPITLDTSAHYTVDGYEGIAFTLRGWAMTEPEPVAVLVCEDDDCDHEHEECWAWDEPEPDESDTWVRVVMVGDDQVHEVEYNDLHPLHEDDYCHQCGQIGCTHDGRN